MIGSHRLGPAGVVRGGATLVGVEVEVLGANGKPIKIQHLRYSGVERCATTYCDAMESDPLDDYLRRTPDHIPRVEKLVNKTRMRGMAFFGATKRIQFTIHQGEANLTLGLAPNSKKKPSKRDRLVTALELAFWSLADKLDTPMQKRRSKEFMDKNRPILAKLGDRLKDMVGLHGLATAPASQGQGYGSALVEFVTSIADSQGRATWLGSSNVANTAFYQSFGFEIFSTFTVGEDDPEWDKEPVVIHFMVREPKRLAASTDEKCGYA